MEEEEESESEEPESEEPEGARRGASKEQPARPSNSETKDL